MGTKRPERLVINRPPDPDPCRDLPVMAGAEGKGLGSWVVRTKHAQLSRYIDASRGAVPGWPGGYVYMDPFCGTGRIKLTGESFTRPGGAVAAWQQSKLGGVPFTKVLVGDLDATSVAACEARLRTDGAPVTAYNLPAIESVRQMVDQVPQGALCLAYIDPFKIGVLAFDIFRTLATKRVDLIVNFFSSDLRRNVDSAKDDLNPGWRDRLPHRDLNRSGLAAAWFDDWQQQVKKLGFLMSNAMKTAENSNNAEMYRLVFFAKKQFPVGLWDDLAADPTMDLFADQA